MAFRRDGSDLWIHLDLAATKRAMETIASHATPRRLGHRDRRKGPRLVVPGLGWHPDLDPRERVIHEGSPRTCVGLLALAVGTGLQVM